MEDLKDSLSRAKSKIRKLEDRVDALESLVKDLTRTPGLQQQTAGASGGADSDLESRCVAAVSHLDPERNLDAIIQRVALMVFSLDEVVNRSRTGKRTSQCKEDGPRPALDAERFELFERILLRQCPNLDKKNLHAKFLNFQKMKRRDGKKK